MEKNEEQENLISNKNDDDDNVAISHSADTERPQTTKCLCCPTLSRRYTLAMAVFISLFLVYCLRGNLSVAMVAMTSNHTKIGVNGRQYEEKAEFVWSSATQGHLLSAFCYGYLVTQIPGGLLAAKYGGKWIFGVSLLVTSLLTLTTPFFTRISVEMLFGLRVMEGACEGCIFPSMYAMWSMWAPPFERSILSTISHTGVYGGAVVGTMTAGLLCEVLGWPWVFYSFGLVGVLWSVVWLLCFYDSPRLDPWIDEEELLFIESSLSYYHESSSEKSSHVSFSRLPWLQMATSLPMIALIVSHISEGWVFSTLHTGLPKFLNEAFNMRIAHAGLFCGTLYFIVGCSVLVGGQISDSVRQANVMSTTNVRKCMLGVGMAMAAFFLALSVTIDSIYSSSLLIILAGLFQGLSWTTIASNPLDLAPRYSSLIFGITNTLATIPGIIAPLAIGYLTPNQTIDEWRIVFYIGAASFLFSAIFYGLFGSGNLQSWSRTQQEIKENKNGS